MGCCLSVLGWPKPEEAPLPLSAIEGRMEQVQRLMKFHPSITDTKECGLYPQLLKEGIATNDNCEVVAHLATIGDNLSNVESVTLQSYRRHKCTVVSEAGVTVEDREAEGPPLTNRALVAFSKVWATGKMPKLRNLCLLDNDFGDAGMTALADAAATIATTGAFANLCIFQINQNHVGDEGMTAFAAAVAKGAFPLVDFPIICSNPFGDKGGIALVDAIADGGMPKLIGFNVESTKVGAATCKALAAACTKGAWPNLEGLVFNHTAIGDDGLGALARGAIEAVRTMEAASPNTTYLVMPRLKQLLLADCGITDKSLMRLIEAFGGGHPGPEELNVMGNPGVTNQSAISLAETSSGRDEDGKVVSWYRLKKLSFAQTSVGAEGCNAIMLFTFAHGMPQGMQHLKWASFAECGISEKDQKRLAKIIDEDKPGKCGFRLSFKHVWTYGPLDE